MLCKLSPLTGALWDSLGSPPASGSLIPGPYTFDVGILESLWWDYFPPSLPYPALDPARARVLLIRTGTEQHPDRRNSTHARRKSNVVCLSCVVWFGEGEKRRDRRKRERERERERRELRSSVQVPNLCTNFYHFLVFVL
jgi:hypothetical protein